MLYAELHGKLSEEASDAERREDILTSTVFGTLIHSVDGCGVLSEWLNRSVHLDQDGRPDSERLAIERAAPIDFWFWPRLLNAESDLVLRFRKVVLIIEAKYHSSKSSVADPSSPGRQAFSSDRDQLEREWAAASGNVPDWYPDRLRQALAECALHLVYLVSARSTGSMDELAESMREIRRRGVGKPSLWRLTWQDLHKGLATVNGVGGYHWSVALRELLERRRLASFLGFAAALPGLESPGAVIGSWAEGWRSGPLASLATLSVRSMSEALVFAGRSVRSWASGARQRRLFPAFNEFDHERILKLAAVGWRDEPTSAVGKE